MSSVATLAQKSLYTSPVESEAGKSEDVGLKLPDFAAMTRCVHEKATARLKNRAQSVTIANSTLPFNLTVVEEVGKFYHCYRSSFIN